MSMQETNTWAFETHHTNPQWMLDMYATAQAGRWDEAITLQHHVSKFYAEMEAFVEQRGEGVCDPVSDKGLSVASGCILGHQRCRAPYIGWSDETIVAMRSWLKQNYPEFIYPE